MPTHRKVSCYGSPNSSKKAGFTTRSYNTVCYMCEGRSVKIMEGEDCFRRGLSYGFKLPFQSYKTVFCVGKNGTYQKKNSSPSVFFRARTVLVRLPCSLLTWYLDLNVSLYHDSLFYCLRIDRGYCKKYEDYIK